MTESNIVASEQKMVAELDGLELTEGEWNLDTYNIQRRQPQDWGTHKVRRNKMPLIEGFTPLNSLDTDAGVPRGTSLTAALGQIALLPHVARQMTAEHTIDT